MAKKLFILLLIIFGLSTLTYAQEKVEPLLVQRGVEEHLSWWLNGELLLDEAALLQKPDTKIAVRICTELPLMKAIRLSKGAPYQIARYLKMRDYKFDRIFILLYKKCPEGEDKRISFYSDLPRKTKKNVDVEVWVVPKSAELPSSDEIYKFSGIKSYRLVKQ